MYSTIYPFQGWCRYPNDGVMVGYYRLIRPGPTSLTPPCMTHVLSWNASSRPLCLPPPACSTLNLAPLGLLHLSVYIWESRGLAFASLRAPMRQSLWLYGSLLVVTLLLPPLHAREGEPSGGAAEVSQGVEVAELRQEQENLPCRARGSKYLKCLQRDAPYWNRGHGPPRSVERQIFCDARFSDYLASCYNPDSIQCQKGRKRFDQCVMRGGHSRKRGVSNSTTRAAYCEEKHWR